MKKILANLSLIILLLSERISPISYVLANEGDNEGGQEQQQETIPVCNDDEYYDSELGECVRNEDDNLSEIGGGTRGVKTTSTISFVTNGGTTIDPIVVDNGNPVAKTFYSHTSNVGDDGSHEGTYCSDSTKNEVITITGESQLSIFIDYSMGASSIVMRTGSHPEYKYTFSGDPVFKIYQDEDTKNYVVDSDTVTFLFYKNSMESSCTKWGYYAVVKQILETSRDGFTFMGWYKDPDFQEEWDIYSDLVEDDMTLYALWGYDVSFHSYGGTQIEKQIVVPGYYAVEPTVTPTRKHSTFTKWYRDEGLNTEFDFNNTPITDNMTLYAGYDCDDGYNNAHNLLCSDIQFSDEKYTCELSGDDESMNNFEYYSFSVGDYTLMDRNLGAKAVYIQDDREYSHYSDDSDFYYKEIQPSFGYYYQWGNNYGFKQEPAEHIWDNPVTKDNIPSNYSNSQPYDYRYDLYNLLDDGGDLRDLWGGVTNTNVARKGPCPEGWHVPSIDEWMGVLDVLYDQNGYDVNAERDLGKDLADDLLLPPVGGNDDDGSGPYGMGTYGYGWSSSASEWSINGILVKNQGIYENGNGILAPVRCFQNKSRITFVEKGTEEALTTIVITGSEHLSSQQLPAQDNLDYALYYTKNNDDEFELIDNILTESFDGDVTIYVDYGYIVNLCEGGEVENCNSVLVGYLEEGDTPTYSLPVLEKDGYEFLGWFTGTNVEDLGFSYSGVIASNLTGEGGEIDLYSHFSKDITITLKPNHNTIKSGDNETTSDIVINTTIYDNNDYTLTFPQILVNENTPDILGFTLGEETYTEPYYNSGDTLSLVDSKVFYAQTKKDIGFTVVPNGNRISDGDHTYEGLQQFEETKTVYNGVNTETFTFPEILANENTPDILGFSTGATYRPDGYVYYQTGVSIILTGSETYYAQTKKDYVEKQAIFLKGQGITQIGGSNEETLYDSCIPATTYNSYVNDTCVVDAPSITVAAGQKPGKWNNEYAGGAPLILSQSTSYFIAGTESNVYSVYYDYNGGSAGELHPSTYNGGETLTISDPSKPGYTFTGWTDQNGNSVVFPINSANGNYHITANWELTPYTITFAGIDDTVTYQDNTNMSYPTSLPCTYEDVFTLDTPSKPGYTFSGWQLEDGTIKKVVTISKTTSNRVLTGVWGSGTYNIVYNLNGGENDERNPESYIYSTTEDVELYSGTRDGYRFDGWYNNRYFVGDKVTKINKGQHEHVVLHAKWTPIIYTITFDGVVGAKLENSDTTYPQSMTGVYDDVITLSTPSKEGYEFDGWSVGNSSTISKTVTLSKLTENKTVTAHWTAKRYTITYYPNGGTNNVNNPESYIYSSTSSILLNDAERVGYHFDGWYTQAEGGVKYTSIPEGAHVNYVFYAHWTANTNTPYKVYHYQESLGGGHLLKDTDSLSGTSNAEVTPAVKSYDGFTVPATQTVTIRPDGETRVEYYYDRNSYSITVNYGGGKDLNNKSSVTYTKKYGDTIEEVIPTRDGYSFNGWSEVYPKTMPVVNGTKTITATWTANAYTITYNNVEYADNYNTRYGYNTSEAFTLANAVWTGYHFDGWFTQAVGGTQVTAITANDHENKVLYAHWTPKTDVKYTVIHRRQGLDQYYNDDNLKEEVIYTNGVTATTIEAEQKNYPGFIPPEVKEITIKGDGTSVVEYRYQRMRFTYASEGNVGVDTKGTTANNQYMFYGAPLTLRATVDTGYSWSGWYIETGDNVYRLFTTEKDTTIGLPAYNSVVKPFVKHDVYTLSFNAAGGIATGTSSLANQNHYYNDEITLPEVVRTGYIFTGWYDNNNVRYEANTRMPVGNVELTAHWIEGEVNVKVEYYLMNLDGSTYPGQPSDKLELQRTTNSIYTGEVKTYEGFKSPNEQSVVVEAEGTSVIKYYYQRFNYQLDLRGLTGFAYVSVVSTNHPNGVDIISGEVQSIGNYYYGETITITGELLTGYGMDKWNGADVIGKNSGTPVFTFTMPAQSVTLTPNVSKNTYKATYKDGDRVIAVYDVVYEEAVPTPKAPSKYGYKFTGWRNYPISGTMPANNIELKAMWEAVPVSGGGGGGGGSSSNDNKKTTNTTGDKQQEHNSAELTGDNQKIDDANKVEEETVKSDEVDNSKEETIPTIIPTSNQSLSVDQEVLTAYQWAYKHGVTTMPTLDEAMPEGVVTRGHLAKMVVNYATNVLGQKIPEKIPNECRWNDYRGDWESQEIKDYAVKACALGLMGLNMKKFQPKVWVSRAQFGTIMSRLLWGKKYAGGTPYYRNHLNALKKNGIMIQIGNPEGRTELRQWVWLMLMRSAENN